MRVEVAIQSQWSPRRPCSEVFGLEFWRLAVDSFGRDLRNHELDNRKSRGTALESRSWPKSGLSGNYDKEIILETSGNPGKTDPVFEEKKDG